MRNLSIHGIAPCFGLTAPRIELDTWSLRIREDQAGECFGFSSIPS